MGLSFDLEIRISTIGGFELKDAIGMLFLIWVLMKPTDFAKRFYRLKDVIRVTSLSRSTIYRYAASGLFPKQIAIAPVIVVRLESDVQKWMSDQIEKNT